MGDGDLLVTRNDGPVSPIFPVHATSIIRAFPFAAQGLAMVPSPTEPVGQGTWGAAAAVADGAAEGGLGAAAEGGVGALCADGAPAGLGSVEQPRIDAATA